MNSIPDDELLSAYLDGELSVEERARVEQMLAEQPEARQLLEDLRALSASLEGLPSHRLEADFATRVLRAAEREMLAGDPPREAPAAPPPSDIASSDAAASSARDPSVRRAAARQASEIDWKRWRRPMAWAGAALAAGLMLMVMERGRQNVAPIEEVARAPKVGVEFRAAEDAAPASARDRRSGAADFEGFGKKPSPQTAPAKGMAGEPSGAGGALRPLDGLGRQTAQGRLGRGEKIAADAPPAPTAPPSPRSAEPAPLQAGGMLGGEGPKVKLRERGLAEAEGLNFYSAGDANAFRFGVERKQGNKIVSEPLDPKTLIVWCDVTENVAARPEFRQLLTGNGIVWDSDAPPIEADLKAGDDKPSAAPDERAKVASKKLEEKAESVNTRFRKEKAGAENDGQENDGLAKSRSNLERRMAIQRADQEQPESEALVRQRSLDRLETVAAALSENSTDYVLLEASEEQLKAVLTEFDQHPELFLTVNVEPSPEAPSQQVFSIYNRGRAPVDRKDFGFRAPSLNTAIVEELNLGKQVARAGRAQQVLVLPQQVQADEQMGATKNDAYSDEKDQAKPAASSSEKSGNPTALGVESKTSGKMATAGQKPASGSGASKSPAGPAERLDARGYQQALIILRRVPAAAATEPEAEEEKPKPPAAKEGAKKSDQ